MPVQPVRLTTNQVTRSWGGEHLVRQKRRRPTEADIQEAPDLLREAMIACAAEEREDGSLIQADGPGPLVSRKTKMQVRKLVDGGVIFFEAQQLGDVLQITEIATGHRLNAFGAPSNAADHCERRLVEQCAAGIGDGADQRTAQS
jgi:hypothetical protein